MKPLILSLLLCASVVAAEFDLIEVQRKPNPDSSLNIQRAVPSPANSIRIIGGDRIPTTAPISDFLKSANNLSDLGDVGIALDNLGGSATGKNIFQKPDANAVRYIRINADNSVDFLDAAAFLAAIGGGGGGTGTVTSVAVTAANGVSAVVATPTTTPTLTFTLGAITPTSVAASGAVTGSNLSGTNTGDQTNITGNAGTANALAAPVNINGVPFDGSTNVTIAVPLATGITGFGANVATALAIAANGSGGIITAANNNIPLAYLANATAGQRIIGRETAAGAWGDIQLGANLAIVGNVLNTVGTGSGDVIGPATNTNLRVPQWNGTNSKTLSDGLDTSFGISGAADNGKLAMYGSTGLHAFSFRARTGTDIGIYGTNFLTFDNGSHVATLSAGGITGSWSWTPPNKSGEFAVTEDVPKVDTLTANYTNATNANVDTALAFAVAANEVWVIEWHTTTTSGVSAGQFRVSTPTGATVEGWAESGVAGAGVGENRARVTAVNALSGVFVNSAASQTIVSVTVTNGANAGTIALGFASVTNGQIITCFAGSSMRRYKKP